MANFPRITGKITIFVSASAATQHIEAPISANNPHPTPISTIADDFTSN
jgi:hypothetical protein